MRKFVWLLVLVWVSPLLGGQRKAPSFDLPSLDGKNVSLDSLLTQGALVIDFWATWCKYCDDELDFLQKLQEEMGDTSFVLVGITIDSYRSISRVKAMAKTHKWKFPILLDTDKRVKERFRVLALPTIFVVDQEKNIILTRMGYNPSQEEEIRKIILEVVERSLDQKKKD